MSANEQDVVVRLVNIPMRDGVLLKSMLIIKQNSLSCNVLLQRTPYSIESSVTMIDALELARKGWAVVIQNVRGRGISAGVFEPFVQEENDGIDTITWIRKQSWSNGRVAMSGASYVGFTAWACSCNIPDGLIAISPQITSRDILGSWFFENKAFRQSFVQSWGLSLAFTSNSHDNGRQKIEYFARNLDKLYEFDRNKSPLREILPQYNEWIKENSSSYLDGIKKLCKTTAPFLNSFHLTGWYDIFCEGALSDFADISNGDEKKVHRLIVGPWGHNTLFSSRVGNINFGYEADGFTSKIMNEIHNWLYDALEGNPLKGGARVFVMGDNTWEEYSTWPPKADRQVRLHMVESCGFNLFRGAFGLAFRKSSILKRICLVHDSKNLPVLKGGRVLDPNSLGEGPFDQRSVLLKTTGDMLFITEKLEKSVKVVGETHVHFFISSEDRLADFSVSILDVCPDGAVYNIVSMTHRCNIKTNEINKLVLAVGSTAMTFKKGHAIGFRITLSNFPHCDLIKKNVKVSVWFGREYDSFLLLPILET